MSDDLFDTPGTDLAVATAPEVVTKDHSAPMSMTEFAGWIQENFGGGVKEALDQAAFMLCCDVISQDIAKASPPRLRKRTGPATSEIVMPTEHPIAGMFALEPNRRHTWPEYTEMSVYWSCLTSNSYAAVFRDRKDNPLEIIPLQTGRVQELVEGRDVFYRITAATQQELALLGAPTITLPERDVIHVRGRMIDGMDGYSTMTAGRKTLDAGKAIDKFRENLFGEEGQQRGVFMRKDAGPEDVVDDIAFQRLRQQFKIMMSRFRQLTEPIVLEGGFDFKAISSNPKDMEFTQQFTAQINAVCRLLRVPPHKVFNMDGVKYENLETSEKMYVGDTLVPVARRFEDRMAKVLLTPKERLEFFVEFDRDAMTLRDPQRETERVVKLMERGAILWDEGRAKLGWNPMPNGQGQARMVPTNMTVVGIDGKVLIAGSSTAKPDEAKAEDKPAEEPKKGLRLVQ